MITEYDKRLCSITFDAGDPTKTATAKFTITEYRPPIGQPFDPAAIESFKQPDPEVFDAPCKIPDANLGREFTFIDPVDKKPVTVPPSHARKCSTPIPSVSEKYLSGEGRARVFKCGVEWTVGTEKHTAVSVPLKIANYVFPVVAVKIEPALGDDPAAFSGLKAFSIGRDPEFYSFVPNVNDVKPQVNTLYSLSNLASDLPKKIVADSIPQKLPLSQLALFTYYKDAVRIMAADAIIPILPSSALVDFLNIKNKAIEAIEKGDIKSMNSDKGDYLILFSPQIIIAEGLATGASFSEIVGLNGITDRALKIITISGVLEKTKYFRPLNSTNLLAHEFGHALNNLCDVYIKDEFEKQRTRGCADVGAYPQECDTNNINYGSSTRCFGSILSSTKIKDKEVFVYDIMGIGLSGTPVKFNPRFAKPPLLIKDNNGNPVKTDSVTDPFDFNPEADLFTFGAKLMASPDSDEVDKFVKGGKIICSVKAEAYYHTILKHPNPRVIATAKLIDLFYGSELSSHGFTCGQIADTSNIVSKYKCETEFDSSTLQIGKSFYCDIRVTFVTNDYMSDEDAKVTNNAEVVEKP